ncbi:AFG1-like ATPase-domain-containing protein [Phakopsora pachyrhizi]|uniref:AFG1-like ATPase-domain-containing protein n=1 Tax=Phakopsora pachyrhizi TaxID=170000 RepID=A0AAV0AE49_PHAPC|nr:AFG1-like ATPase-domain-containing protein [Phakopsora pachyrhizi]CAH7666152.1 AFG1-like ATPase-domain-containing protein [Phakopsora pachyrhizi]
MITITGLNNRTNRFFFTITTVTNHNLKQHLSLRPTDLINYHRNLLINNQLKSDQHQITTIHRLDKLHRAIKSYQPNLRLLLESFDRALLSEKSFSQSTLRSNSLSISNPSSSNSIVRLITPSHLVADLDAPQGFLLTGSPGTGKSMMMDMFFDSLPISTKFRMHYHHFLISLYDSVSERLKNSQTLGGKPSSELDSVSLLDRPVGYLPPRQDSLRTLALSKGWRSVFAGGSDPSDPVLNGPEFVLAQVARDLITQKGWLLAFDEIQMVDVAGAGILSRVLEWYWRLGGVVIGTSNRSPEHMYDQGVHRAIVEPFLQRLRVKSPEIKLESKIDWRIKLSTETTMKNSSSSSSSSDLENPGSNWFDRSDRHRVGHWNELLIKNFGDGVDEHRFQETEIKVYGRTLKFNRTRRIGNENFIMIIDYKDFFEEALGAVDYLKACSKFEKIFIENLPVFTTLMKNEARRFITFLDAAYECRVKLHILSNSSIVDLFFPLKKPKDSDLNDTASIIELESLSELKNQSFRPNVSRYSSQYQKDVDEGLRIDYQDEEVVEKYAIYTGEDERFAYQRAISRLFELTSGNSDESLSKPWNPNLDLFKPRHTSTTTSQAQGNHTLQKDQDSVSKDKQQPLTDKNLGKQERKDEKRVRGDGPKRISEEHFWGIRSEGWGERVGRWGRGVEIFKGGRSTNKKD